MSGKLSLAGSQALTRVGVGIRPFADTSGAAATLGGTRAQRKAGKGVTVRRAQGLESI